MIVHQWVVGLEESQFIELLPILARTAASFSPAEAQQLVQKVAQKQVEHVAQTTALDVARAQAVLDEIYAYLQPVAVES